MTNVNYTKAKFCYRIRSAVVMYGLGSAITMSVAIMLAWLLSVLPSRGGYKGGTLTLLLIDLGLFGLSPVLFIMMLYAMVSGSAVISYFRLRVKDKKNRADLAGRTKYLTTRKPFLSNKH